MDLDVPVYLCLSHPRRWFHHRGFTTIILFLLASSFCVMCHISHTQYQLGVFLSRSSGAYFVAPMWVLWLMPFLQLLNLAFFYAVAVYQFWYNYALLLLCFYVGLLGGGVYVNAYMRMNRDLPPSVREFALSTASAADSFGILCANVSGLFIQSCLYRYHGIKGAVVTCPA